MVDKAFAEVLREAIDDVSLHGYDSITRIEGWLLRIRAAAEQATRSSRAQDDLVRDALVAIYQRLVERGGILRSHTGLARVSLDRIQPHLRAELDRRILASTDLVKINREDAIRQTLKRFSGWSTSIPKGGSAAVDKRSVAQELKKPVARQKFEASRVAIDQGHKLRASISQTIAEGSNAIALIWHSHWRQSGYAYRRDHKERDLEIYMLRGNWAQAKGFAKPGRAGYYDQITSVGEEVFCRCYAQYLYSLSALPPEMLTNKGRDALASARSQLAS